MVDFYHVLMIDNLDTFATVDITVKKISKDDDIWLDIEEYDEIHQTNYFDWDIVDFGPNEFKSNIKATW